MKSKLDVVTILAMAFNFISAVGIIFVNKIVFLEYNYNFATFLTALHFATTFIGLYILQCVNYFKIRKVPLHEVISLCIAFCGFVIFNNLSLQENTVGFYQLMKVMTTPVVAAIQFIFFGIYVQKKLIFSLMLVIVGVTIVTVSEVELRMLGLAYAILGILSTSFYQVWVKSRQQDLQLSAPQLLYYQAPISAIMVVFLTPFFDQILNNVDTGEIGLSEYEYTKESVAWILLSCFLAFCVNLSIFLTIGRTSPISYNVLGHFKLCIITIGGIILFKEDMNNKKLFGIAVALVGITLYTFWKMQLENAWEIRDKHIQHELQKNRSNNENDPDVTASNDDEKVLLLANDESKENNDDVDTHADIKKDIGSHGITPNNAIVIGNINDPNTKISYKSHDTQHKIN